MTNKIMQNNSLYNINNNKELTNKLSTQMSTKKKLTRPSDDPVIAIRALRLRSDVSQITQFYERNAKDGESWLKVTGDALETTSEILKSMIGLCTQGAVKDFDAGNMAIVIAQLKELKNEFYSTGNVDYAGRYMFTGYRTDTPLTFTENLSENPADPSYRNFEITEQLDVSAFDTINYTNIGDLKGVTKDNYDPVNDGVKEEEADITNSNIHRIRLSYDAIKADNTNKPTITMISEADKQAAAVNGTKPQETTLIAQGDIEVVSSTAVPNPYDYVLANPGKAVLIPETGELLIGEDLYNNNPSLSNMDAGTEMRITYQKDSWKKGDMQPQHYFACKDVTDPNKVIEYNHAEYENTANNPPTIDKYIPCDKVTQFIEYDVGYNQRIRVNTTADEVFTMDMDRNIDDMENALAKLEEIEAIKKDLEKMMDGMEPGEAGYANLKASYDAAEKAHTYVRENMQKMMEGLITKTQKISDFTSLAITDNGTRASRLDLISNRLMTQKSTFETLQSANEDIDVTEVTVKLTSMDYSYQSALLATGKILQNSLMNYI
jgi:flagellar hook-associated protein 3 FlgL